MGSDKRRYIFKIYNFNTKTRQVELTQRLVTKIMTQHDFNRLLKSELAKPVNKNCCWEMEGR